jgi:mannosyl-3-phosphoglycerate phosphatase
MTWIVYTDLDETLLDRETYSFAEAAPALEGLAARGIPLVPCTSKTAAETLHVLDLLRMASPFIVEGGAALYVPKSFKPTVVGWVDRGRHWMKPLAAGREEVLRGFAALQESAGGALRGFSEMNVDEVAKETGLPLEQAAMAMKREFDEPFRIEGAREGMASKLAAVARARGLVVSAGGRFHHLHGDTDKGRAVREMTALYWRALGRVRTIGVGDSDIDRPMLDEVDVPIALPHRDGTVARSLAGVPGVRRAEKPGPAGWSQAVLAALAKP